MDNAPDKAVDPVRDEQLRRSLVDLTKQFGDGGYVAATKLAIAARDFSRRGVDDEAHAERLIEDLVGIGLIEPKPGQPFGLGKRELRHKHYRITDLGWQLWAGRVDPMPGIAGRDE